LTGGIASGKSIVARDLARSGAVVIDADELARAAVAPGSDALSEIREVFGPEVITESGELNRQALAQLVFGNTVARESLNDIIHPRVRQEVQRIAREAGPEAVVVVDLPLLVETASAGEFDVVLTVETPAEARVNRLVHERGMSMQEAWARVDSQATDAERREVADQVIVNDASLNDLSEATRRFWDDHVQPVVDEHQATTDADATLDGGPQ
jgi:dephospho-CoA kinase